MRPGIQIRSTQDVGRLVGALKGADSYKELVRRHGDVSRSIGAWWAWHHGAREMTLLKLIEVTRALGGDLVVEVKGGHDA